MRRKQESYMFDTEAIFSQYFLSVDMDPADMEEQLSCTMGKPVKSSPSAWVTPGSFPQKVHLSWVLNDE
jgi:hypothetical protein